MEYPKIKQGLWLPMLEQREYLEDAEKDAWTIKHVGLGSLIGVNVKIVKEPAEITEIWERKILGKMSLKKQSPLRGFLETLNPIW